MSTKYTHIFFDLDNTLWDFDHNSYIALREALKKTGLLDKTGNYDDYYKIFESVNDSLWALYREGKLAKKELRLKRFEESFEKNGTPFPKMSEKVNDAYIDELPAFTQLIEGARELLDYLHGKYEMAVITNGSKEVQTRKIVQSGLEHYFRRIFTSGEIGAPKPKRAIFEHALKSMNARKKSSLMIGDSWDADIVGAMQYGIDQIYYSPRNGTGKPDVMKQIDMNKTAKIPEMMKEKSEKATTRIISSLSELFDIL